MKIKVCGVREVNNIRAVADLRPDYMGFIRYEKSPRYEADLPVEGLRSMPSGIIKTGVFVNADSEMIHQEIQMYGFKGVQFHGSENPDHCAEFEDSVEVIKAFGIDEDFDFNSLKVYEGAVDFFLFDTKTADHGGTGRKFDWKLLNNYTLNTPFFLSGGLSLDNLVEVKNIKHPAFYGVDVNSRFEITPGIKNVSQLKEAFQLIKVLK